MPAGRTVRPRLTKKALAGLVTLVGYVEAGGPADILGYDESSAVWHREGFDKQWAEIEEAIDWVRKVQDATGAD